MLALAGGSFLASCAGTASGPAPPAVDRDADFAARCRAPGVIRCLGLDSELDTDPYIRPPWGQAEKRGRIVTDIKASGAGSLRFEIPSNSGNDTSGSLQLSFADDLSVQFGEGDEFFVQWRQRFSNELLRTAYRGGGGWKQIIVGEGDRPGQSAPGCSEIEIVVQNVYQRGYPQLYHSCGIKDGQFEELGGGPDYVANEWMTFMLRIKIGTWYRNDRRYRGDSTVQFWAAREGRPLRLVVNRSRYDLVNTNPAVAKYGKVILTPYHTGKDASQRHPTAYVWYDELIVSRSRIADPG